MKTLQAEIAIIGGGAAGLSLAAGAAQLGLDVVLIEAGEMGGDCLNTGCVPSKTLLSIAKSVYFAKKNTYINHDLQSCSVDFSKIMGAVADVIEKISVHDSQERFNKLGVQVIRAPARFTDLNNLEAGDFNIQAKKIVIATGSNPLIPNIKGLASIDYFTNENIFKLQTLPEHLIVIGGGPIGCELAQAFVMLGAKVTLLEAFNILPKDDAECVNYVRNQLITCGVDLREGVKIDTVDRAQDKIRVMIYQSELNEKISISGTHLLVATGRKPCVAGLALETAGISYTAKGIQVDKRLRTTNKSVYAIGDVIGNLQFTHAANYHAGIVLKNLAFKMPSKFNPNEIPWVTYTYPEIAHAGAFAHTAQYTNQYQSLVLKMSENDRAQAEQDVAGMIKVWVDKRGKIQSVTIVDPQAGELIQPWIMAIKQGLTLRSFTDMIIPYPTRGEISKRVASQFYVPKLFSPQVKRLVRFLQKIG